MWTNNNNNYNMRLMMSGARANNNNTIKYDRTPLWSDHSTGWTRDTTTVQWRFNSSRIWLNKIAVFIVYLCMRLSPNDKIMKFLSHLDTIIRIFWLFTLIMITILLLFTESKQKNNQPTGPPSTRDGHGYCRTKWNHDRLVLPWCRRELATRWC